MEADFRSILANDAGVTALVPAERISYRQSPQGIGLPRITFQIVSTVPSEELDQESGWTRSRVQIDVWAGDDAETLAVMNAINDCLKGFAGTVGATRFFGIFRANRRDQNAKPLSGQDMGERRLTLDWMVNHLD